MFRGKYDGRPVAIKVVRPRTIDAGLFRSVRTPFYIHHKKSQLTPSLQEVLPRGRRMEAPTTPEHSAVARCDVGCDGAVQVCVGVRVDGLR